MKRLRRGDDGFAMVFVLLVTAMVTVAVASVLTVTTPDISRTKLDQDGQGAGAAARAAVDDFISYLLGIDRCRSTTRVCAEALGASSGVKTLDRTNGSTMSWTSDASLTSNELVRVHATGTYGRATRTLDADLRLAPSILSYGYYSDYESQSSSALSDIYRARTVKLDRSGAWNNVTVASLSSATLVTWAAPDNTTNCDRHWWTDSSTNPVTPARGTGGWTAKPTFDTASNSKPTYTGGCDVVFATGMTFDGPVYSRDALFVDGTGGQGPKFQQPVLTGWGSTSHNSPAVPATTSTTGPWRQQNGGTLSSSPNQPVSARFDLTLPDTIGTDDVASNACVYTGPTRVVLNGDGTATVTSPLTRTKASGADYRCYPTVLDGNGVVRWTIAYGAASNPVGGGAVLVKNIGTQPASGWPTTGQKSTTTPSASTSAFWTTATGGTASTGTSAASDTGCTSSVTWSASVNATCAWSETPTYTATSDGWTAASTGACSTAYAATDQRRFECEYSNVTSGTPSKTYTTFRTAVKNALSTSSCATPDLTAAQRQQCLVTLVTAQLPAATTSVRYVVTPTTGTASAGTTRALTAGAPAFPQSTDPIFANGPTTTGTESSTYTPVTLVVNRQTSSNGGSTWAGTTPQFKLTVTSTTWAVATASTATSYFPAVNDVTQYASSANTSTAAGDLYVEGTNKGRLSLLADNDVVITNNLRDASSDITADAVNIVAGDFVRNYHPVACVSTTAASINATSPGYCPNDITALRRSTDGALTSNGQFTADDPSQQYSNIQAAADRTVDAAMFALNGSLSSDNYNRGTYVGAFQINGGIYQEHRGTNGSQSGSGSSVARTGYLLQYHYVDQRLSNLPYEPTTKVKSGRVWSVVTVAGGGAS